MPWSLFMLLLLRASDAEERQRLRDQLTIMDGTAYATALANVDKQGQFELQSYRARIEAAAYPKE